MKLSLNTIKKFIDIELPPVDELVRRINEQLGGVEEVIDVGAKYQGIVIAKVVNCVPHPDSDHMHVCEIDVGDFQLPPSVEPLPSGLVQVVCGAPNVREGIMVAWLPPGSTVPSSYDTADPFVLGARMLRGVMSNGMLASPAELAISDNHDGIQELTESDLPYSHPELDSGSPESAHAAVENPNEDKYGATLRPGMDFATIFGLDDVVIDIENKMFTHRPDCFGVLGVAREISAILGGVPANADAEAVDAARFVNPDWYWLKPTFRSAEGLELHVENATPEKVPRLMAVAMKDVRVGPSPLWLQCELIRLGGKSINNIVDLTNYIMLLTGQPTHAYDYNTLRGATLVSRLAKAGESVTLLNGKTYTLNPEDVVIADAEGVIGLAGIMGGSNSEVSADTKNIVLEVANFDMYALRRSSMRHGVFTDALTRFSKGQSPLQNDRILARLMEDMSSYAGATQASPVFDLPDRSGQLDEVSLSGELSVSAAFVNERLGLQLAAWQIGGLLRRANFASYPEEGDENTLLIGAPFWRTDIQLPEDIVEEVGRLYGFDKLPRELPNRRIIPASANPLREMKRKIGHLLSDAGANEVKTYSFIHERVLKGACQDSEQAFRLGNALSPDLQYYRVSLLPSLLAHIHPNVKAGYDEFALFEFGKAHNKQALDADSLPQEAQSLAYVYASKKPQSGAAYYRALHTLQHMLEENGITGLRLEALEGADLYHNPWLEQMVAPFDPKRSAVLRATDDSLGATKGLVWGVVGEYKASVRRAFKLPEYCAGFELDPTLFLYAAGKTYRPLSRFPHVTQDISLKVSCDTPYAAVYASADQALQSLRSDSLLLDLSPSVIYQPEDAQTKTVTLRLRAVSHARTLTDVEVARALDTVAQTTAKDCAAERV
jgi:phenylalanyl-tRNA synthetase beta chain